MQQETGLVSDEASAGAGVPVLAYHSISADGPADLAPWRIPPGALARQLGWLRGNGYCALRLDEVPAALQGRLERPGKPVLITFDDGYADFADTAWPLLRAFGFVATVFVVTGRVGGQADWDRDYGPPKALMSWDQIRALAREGVEFGSHTHTHAWLFVLSGDRLAAEFETSGRMIADELGQRPRSLCYPGGGCSAGIATAAGAAGYSLGFTTRTGLARAGDPPLLLPRLEVLAHHDLGGLAALLSGQAA